MIRKMTITLDHDGYPTDASLIEIERAKWVDAAAVLDAVKAAWHWQDFATHDLTVCESSVVHVMDGELFLRLSTGGWSGNESLVKALMKSEVGKLTWALKARGGLWIFRYPRIT